VPKFVYSRYRLNKEISIQNNTNNFIVLNWDQFDNFNGFSNYIANSGQVSSMYFLYNSFIIQQKPKYQKFIISKQDEVSLNLSGIQLIVPMPISRPLYFLKQKTYWDSLIVSYFKNVHPMAPLFSVHSFNPNTAEKSLLSAIYYGGFQFIQDKSPQLVKYFNEYAECNIKKIIRYTSLQNAQATFIYSFLMLLSGNFKLFKACQAHAIRMSYLLGIHLNLKRLTPIQQYDRTMLFSTTSAFHIAFCGMRNLTLNQLTELGDIDTELLQPEYQIPNSNCAFYFDREDENIVYGVSVHRFFILYYIHGQHLCELGRCNNHSIQNKLCTYINRGTQKYYETMSTFDLLVNEFPHLESTIQSYKLKLTLYYHIVNLEMYRILRCKVKNLKPIQVSKMLEECVILVDSIMKSQGLTQIAHTYPYTTALYFISIYPIANTQQKSIIKQKLHELLDYLSKRPVFDKVSYLIIKKEYESILKS
jgi:hypothetical protein